MTIKVGGKVKDKYRGHIGIVKEIWDGKYTCSYYMGGQFNPYRIIVQFGQDYIDKFGSGILGDGTVAMKLESLEKLDEK